MAFGKCPPIFIPKKIVSTLDEEAKLAWNMLSVIKLGLNEAWVVEST